LEPNRGGKKKPTETKRVKGTNFSRARKRPMEKTKNHYITHKKRGKSQKSAPWMRARHGNGPVNQKKMRGRNTT